MLKKLDDNRYLVPRNFRPGMVIEGLIYANEALIKQIEKDQTLDQPVMALVRATDIGPRLVRR